MVFMLWKSLKSGNTVTNEYLNRIPNPEYRIPNKSGCTCRIQPQCFQQRKPSVQINKINCCTLTDFQEPKISLIYLVIHQ